MKKQIFKLAVFLLALASTSNSFAQMTYGGRLGLNMATISGDYENDEAPGLLPAFYIGATLNYELSDQLFLAPELNFSAKGAKDKSEFTTTVFGVTSTTKSDIKSKNNYLEIPINVGYKLGDKAFVKAGPYFGFLMSANAKGSSETTISGAGAGIDGTTTTDVDAETKDFYNGLDLGVNVGVGLNFTENLGAEVRFSQGLSNIADGDNGGDTFHNRVISVGVFYLLGN